MQAELEHARPLLEHARPLLSPWPGRLSEHRPAGAHPLLSLGRYYPSSSSPSLELSLLFLFLLLSLLEIREGEVEGEEEGERRGKEKEERGGREGEEEEPQG